MWKKVQYFADNQPAISNSRAKVSNASQADQMQMICYSWCLCAPEWLQISMFRSLTLWEADVRGWPFSISVGFVGVNGHLSPLSSHADTDALSLSLSASLRCAEGALCLLRGGCWIVSLSQLYDQVAAVNGHRIKATSLKTKEKDYTDRSIMCEHPHIRSLRPFYDRIHSPWRQRYFQWKKQVLGSPVRPDPPGRRPTSTVKPVWVLIPYYPLLMRYHYLQSINDNHSLQQFNKVEHQRTPERPRLTSQALHQRVREEEEEETRLG